MMNRGLRYFASVLTACCFAVTSFAFQGFPVRLLSLDKKLLYEFEIRRGRPGYSISYEGKKLLGFSGLDIVFEKDSLSQVIRLEKASRLDSVEKYSLRTGRSSAVEDSFRQISLYLKETNPPGRAVVLTVRAFDDGIAFRYEFPGSYGDSLRIREEKSAFQITGNPFVHALVLDGFKSSHEDSFFNSAFFNSSLSL